MPSAAWNREFRRKLLAWFRKEKRALPWRLMKDPYRVWLSEIMLQQTQVATVIPYYQRFLERFPTVEKLAAANEAEVLRLWEGLGYYRRARQLHAAAQQVVSQHAGIFPTSFDGILGLPGVGRYTAGAIASIACGLRTPILEANTIRLYCRLLAYREDPLTTEGQKLLWEFAAAVLPDKGAGDINQALMELGSLVCTPRNPRCHACPVSSLCPTFAAGLQDAIPVPKKKVAFEEVREAAVVIRRGAKILLRQRPHGERWAGLWDFARFPLLAHRGKELHDELHHKVHTQTGMRVLVGSPFAKLKHGVTRFRITLECYEAKYLSGSTKQHEGAALRWALPAELEELPLSVTGRKLARLIQTQAMQAKS